MTKRSPARPRTPARSASPPPAAELYRIGNWSDQPNYGCPFCDWATLDGDAEVVAHIATVHRSQARNSQEA